MLKDLEKRWNGKLGVEDISLEIPEGSFTALLGPSGCGKSTTLRLIAGLELPDSSQIFIDGKEVTTSAASNRNLSMVFQSYALFPHLSVTENVVFGLKVRRVPKKERQEKLHRALEITGNIGRKLCTLVRTKAAVGADPPRQKERQDQRRWGHVQPSLSDSLNGIG